MTPERLLVLMGSAETEHVEFKKAETTYHFNNILKYMVALSNEGGGELVLGVTDKIPRKIVGTQVINDTNGMIQKVYEALRFRIRIDVLKVQGKRVVVCTAPPRQPGVPVHHDGSYWMRNGESVVGMSVDQLKKILAETNNTLHDPILSCQPDDLHQLLLFEEFYKMRGRPVPALESVVQELEDRRMVFGRSNRIEITKLGALTLAKDLRKFDLGRAGPRLVQYSGLDNTSMVWNGEARRGYAVGFVRLVEEVHKRTIRMSFGALRKEESPFPIECVREVVANALVHQDLSAPGRVMVEIFEDRVQVTSPGAPVVKPERFIDKHQSRNESLADVMRQLGICEEVGSGIVKVVRAAESARLQAPDFSDQEDSTRVLIHGPRSFEQMGHFDRLRACYQHACVLWLRNDRLTNNSLRFRFGLPMSESKKISNLISAAVDRGLIRQFNDSKRYAKYMPFWA